MTERIIGPDNSKDVVHYVYPNGKKLTAEELDPNVGGWHKKCRHIYEYTGTKVCPNCGRDTHDPDFKELNAYNKQWLKDNPDAYKQVGWWSI